ncbi:probable ribonuclease ZC3H12C isoform X1 [Haliotis cracherodii]|uniref:probable ribonuclease ZC3H12C isoform X1 n=2 Tax=Haliotis cracherodii TaxID=6455 RepID=UPI0039ECD690
MAEDEVSIHGSKLSAVERCKERVSRLFGVATHTSFIALKDDGPCKIRLCAVGPKPQESLEKAKIYLEAVLGEDPSVVRDTLTFSPQDLDMVQKYHDKIEFLSQAFVEILPQCTLRIQGKQTSVNLVRDCISQVLNRDSVLPVPSNRKNIASLSVSCVDSSFLGDRLSPEHFTDGAPLSPAVSDHLRSDEVGTDNTESSHSSQSGNYRPDLGLIERGTFVADIAKSPVSVTGSEVFRDNSISSSSRSDSSESDLDMDRFNSAEYKAKLEKAVKLGYSEEQLIQALQKLGFDADQNQVLSEMIKLGSSSKGTQEEARGFDERIDSFEDVDGLIERRKRDVVDDSSNLRHIVIDGSNVAMSHGKDVFSCHGIQLAVDWFRQRGHENITVFVPQWRKETSRPDAPITDQDILLQLERDGILSFTPARRVGGRRVVCYDDRYILKLAAEVDGIVVSNDNYRDLVNEKPEFKKVVEERLLLYTFAFNRFMPPDDPLGRRGPTLDNFLRKEPTVPEPLPPECPYGKKCTYGSKCRYHHPERKNQPHQLVTDKLKEQAKQKMQEWASKGVDDKKKPRDLGKKVPRKQPLSRTQSVFPAGLSDEFMAPASITGTDLSDMAKPDKPDYNDKLDKLRKNLERAEKDRKVYTDDREPSPSIVGRRTPNYDFPGLAQQDNQLKVPLSQPKEGLVSGHLLLAKKLSDEAQDSKFFRKDGDHSPDDVSSASAHQFTYPPSPQRPASQSSGLGDSPYHHRVSPHHMLPPQPEPGVCLSGPSALMRQDGSSGGSFEYDQQCQSFPLPPTSFLPQHHAGSGGGGKKGQMMYWGYPDEVYGHSSLHHAPSAPSHSGHVSLSRTMQRQNSTSDPQLHMVGADGERMKYDSDKGMPHAYSSSIHQYSPFHQQHQAGEAGYPQGAGYMHGWGEVSGDMISHPVQRTYHPSPQDQYSPAGQERKVSSDYGVWNRPGSIPQSPVNPYSPQANMSHVPFQQPVQQPMHLHMQSSSQIPFSAPSSMPQRVDAPIEVSDSRYGLYYHLCGLFPQAKVTAVMNQHPEEMDPKILCTYIMSLGERLY